MIDIVSHLHASSCTHGSNGELLVISEPDKHPETISMEFQVTDDARHSYKATAVPRR